MMEIKVGLLKNPQQEISAGEVRLFTRAGIFPFRRLREATTLLTDAYDFSSARMLAESCGPYAVDEFFERLLAKRGAHLQDGVIPYTGPLPYAQEKYLAAVEKRAYDEEEILSAAAARGLCVSELRLSESEFTLYQQISALGSSRNDLNQLRLASTLFAHERPYFDLILSRRFS